MWLATDRHWRLSPLLPTAFHRAAVHTFVFRKHVVATVEIQCSVVLLHRIVTSVLTFQMKPSLTYKRLATIEKSLGLYLNGGARARAQMSRSVACTIFIRAARDDCKHMRATIPKNSDTLPLLFK